MLLPLSDSKCQPGDCAVAGSASGLEDLETTGPKCAAWFRSSVVPDAVSEGGISRVVGFRAHVASPSFSASMAASEWILSVSRSGPHGDVLPGRSIPESRVLS